jgi:ABC-type branched-subunit amino acid transport system substrate-binding protein
VPLYVWAIHFAEMAGRESIFGNNGVRCNLCTTRFGVYAAAEAGATTVGSLGYGVSQASKDCVASNADSVELYGGDTGLEVGYVNDALDFGLPNGIGPEVSAMKDAGVDFISTCIDLNGMKTLGQELDRQGMQDVTLYHPNTYDQGFVADAGGIFDGDYVAVQFRPFESDGAGTALEDFLTWMDKAGTEPTELAMVGWINASLAFDGLLAAGPEFDRDKVTGATNAMTAYNAGGVIEPVDWTTAHTPYTQATRGTVKDQECTALVQVEDGAFVTVGPKDKPWQCWSQADLAWSEPVETSFR